MKIAEKLYFYRSDNHMTLKELSEKSEVSISFISDIENKRRNPSIETLTKLAKALSVPTQLHYLSKVY